MQDVSLIEVITENLTLY